MIFPVKKREGPKKVLISDWKKLFKQQIYRQNYRNCSSPFCDHQKTSPSRTRLPNLKSYSLESTKQPDEQYMLSRQQIENLAVEQALTTLRSNSFALIERGEPNLPNPYNRNSVYIPVLSNIHCDDELKNTFLYIRSLTESSKQDEIDQIYETIGRGMWECKKKDEELGNKTLYMDYYWQKCKNKLIASLDILAAIDMHVEFTKNGYKEANINKFKQLRKSNEVLSIVLLDKIQRASKYIVPRQKFNRSLKISIQSADEINMINMSKTMKQLYCSICMIYDCGKHALSEECNYKMFHYYSLANKKSDENKYQSAFKLCLFYQEIKLKHRNRKFNQDPIDSKVCGLGCYKNLSFTSFQELSLLKSKILSPINIGLISIGIEIFSFEPCFIAKLFYEDKLLDKNHQVTCGIIFAYLVQQKNLQNILEHKLHSSELLNLQKEPECLTIEPIKILLPEESYNKFKKINGNKLIQPKQRARKRNIEEEQLKFTQNTVCFHHFIGQEQRDIRNCRDCDCQCKKRGFCLPQCSCWSECSLLLTGCKCKSKDDCKSIKCPCYRDNNQCVPGVCQNCFSFPKKNKCSNDEILRNKKKLVYVGPSSVSGAGLGAFAGESIKAKQLVTIYTGQLISEQMLNIRQKTKKGTQLYGFSSIEGSLDARFKGNKSRFVNHESEKQGKTNVQSRIVYSLAQEHIALYAQRNIEEGEELFFDYDVERANDRNLDMSFFGGRQTQ